MLRIWLFVQVFSLHIFHFVLDLLDPLNEGLQNGYKLTEKNWITYTARSSSQVDEEQNYALN